MSTIGPGAADRASDISGWTFIDASTPATEDGTITELQIYLKAASSGVDIKAALFTASGNTLTTVSGSIRTITLGSNYSNEVATFSAPGDFVAIDVSEGDYLGFYAPSGTNQEYATSGGSGGWYKSGDYTNVSSVSFSYNSGWIFGFGGTVAAGGTTAPIGTLSGPLGGPLAGVF